jgi:DNA-binding NarL/FixJ family response regulator
METQNKITVVLADDHTVIREGLRVLIEASGDIAVVGQAENGRQAVQLVQELHPNVAILDVAMPQLNGLEATRQIVKKCPETKVLILSTYSEEDCVYRLLEEGATGYLVKQTALHDLLKAIREAHKGNAFLSPTISKRLLDHYRNAFQRGEMLRKTSPRLTTREAEILQLIAEGYANKQIADELSISIKTVEKHRQQLMQKLNIHEVASLTRYAIAKGIVETPVPLQSL